MRYIVTPLHRIIFPTVVWRTHEPCVHLTFDDGPHPAATPKVLKVLMRYGIRCDFFFVGKAVMDYGALAKEIVAAGHRAGNHSFTHRNLLLCSKQRIGTEIERATEVIARATGKTVVNFRPPFGYFDYRTLSMASRLKKNIIMWTIDAGDFQAVSVHTITKRIRKKLQPGSIILLHDNHLTEKRIPELLPRVIDSILEAGLSISPLPA